MIEPWMLVGVDWLLRVGLAVGIFYAVSCARRERTQALEEVGVIVQLRLAELLPLPHLGDRGTLVSMLRDIAPGHDLAVYTAGEPPLLVARRSRWEPPGAGEARWIEVHRDALLTGEVVREEHCGTLVPLRLRDGRLVGALIVATHTELTLDAAAWATLRHVTALIALTRRSASCVPGAGSR